MRDSSTTSPIAVVTGGLGGIGRALCIGLKAQAMTVVVLDQDGGEPDSELAEAVEDVLAVDVTSRDEVGAAAQSILARMGRVDVLVNCAGIGGRGAALDYEPELFARVMAVNVLGTFICCQAFGKPMTAVGRGSIINVSSVGAIVGFSGSVGYQASKGAVAQLTRSLAVEWAPHGVRVNAIAPGHTKTPLVERQWAREPELREYFESRTPMGHLATPEDMVGAVVYLASEAAAMVTGQTITIDGGFTVQ